MKYTKLILSGYKRLALKNIHHFEFSPTAPVQLILGTNGSGKSSIISELSPLPANSSDFHKDGYKEIHVDTGDAKYVLRSSFGAKQEHSIIKDNDQELNAGGTITVQKELVNQLFGYTQDVQDILIFRTRFTQMSPSERRHWFTKLSNTNYDYAIRVYNKIREKYRDTTGAVKTLKKRLVQETEKIVDIDFQKKLELEVDEIHKILSTMLEYRKPLDDKSDDLRAQENQLYKEVSAITISLITFCRNRPGIGAISFDEIDDDIATTLGDIRANEITSDGLMREISKIDESLDILQKTQGSSVDELTSNTLRLQAKESELLRGLTFLFDDNVSYNTYFDAYNAVSESVTHIVSTLTPNPNKYYSRATFQLTTEALKNLQVNKNALQTRLTALQAKKQHHELHRDSPSITCPKCSHSWLPIFGDMSYEDILEGISVHEAQLNSLELNITESTELLNNIQTYFQLFNSYNQITTSWVSLKPLWDVITDSDLLFNSPDAIINILNEFNSQLSVKKELDTVHKEIAECIKLIELTKSVSEQDASKLSEQRSEKEARLYEVSTGTQLSRQNHKYLSELKADKREMEKLTRLLESLLNQVQDVYNRTNETTRREMFNECIRTIQTTLSRKELAISEIRGQRSIIGDIENHLRMLEQDEKALKLLVDELSPTDGLIAEGLFGFIKVFVKQLNHFIGKVWTYDMNVLTCAMDDNDRVDLDYKFPVQIPGFSTPVPDVSRCSTGQQEIMNLAFVVLAMKQLGLGSNPIMLDEFAANMDNSHRVAAIGIVKSLIEQHSFSQLYMVNHYDGIYGAFTNAQVTVICDENIVIPKDCIYNQHVVIR